jgi:hypothetical protein
LHIPDLILKLYVQRSYFPYYLQNGSRSTGGVLPLNMGTSRKERMEK